ncbi:pyocin activator PrtN family protein [Pseudomonas tructae]|nr:pyocin activator PrtN family protein [Pseudomonas tructae]
MKLKIARGEIRLPLIAMERRQKSAHGVYVADLAEHIDSRRAEALKGI